MKEKTIVDYLNIPINTKTIYGYGSYRLLKSLRTTDSSGKACVETYHYPHENMLSPICEKMVQKNLLDYPIRKDIQIGNYNAKTFWLYADGLSSNPDLVLLQEIGTQKGYEQPDTEIVYSNYDSWGNPTDVNTPSEGDCCYIWSYNGAYPVAYIVGATSDEVRSVLGTGLINYLENSAFPSDEKIQSIRTLLAHLDVLVTTYTYSPLIGVTSITAPNGIKETYDYDIFGRLHQTRNNQNDVISRHLYHYAE